MVAPLLHPMDYYKKFEVVPGVIVEFIEAGHILGSAAMNIEIQEGSRKTAFGSRVISVVPGCPLSATLSCLWMSIT